MRKLYIFFSRNEGELSWHPILRRDLNDWAILSVANLSSRLDGCHLGGQGGGSKNLNCGVKW